jgi:hypothetical protein
MLQVGIGQRNKAMVENKQVGQKEILAKPGCEMLWRMNHRQPNCEI